MPRYPKKLEETVDLPDGQHLLLRPVHPKDEHAFQDLFAHMSREDVRMRFFGGKRALSQPVAAPMTQIDYDREMGLVLADPKTPGESEVFGAVYVHTDAGGNMAEYDIMLRSDMAGLGLGPLLMRRIIDYSRKRGIKEIFGEVLRTNEPMLRICDLFHFSRKVSPDDPSVVEVRLAL